MYILSILNTTVSVMSVNYDYKVQKQKKYLR